LAPPEQWWRSNFFYLSPHATAPVGNVESSMNAAKQRRLGLFGILGGLITVSLLLAGGKSPTTEKTIALVGGRILTQTDAGAVQGTILIRDGKIAAVGADIKIPADAERIDVTGHLITPGLIDARSTLWLTAAAARES